MPAADTNQLKTILGLRYAKEETGIRVRRLHFKASWEGKQSGTDGHNTDIKSRRESAMRAGEPLACLTPETEARAQLHSDGIPDHILLSYNTTFKRFALPNIAVDSSSEESYVQFTQNPVVLAIKTALETLGTKDQKHRFSLASLLSMYPQDWVTRYVDKLGKTTMRNAKDKSGQESSDVNLLLLSDRLRDCHSNHLR
jgi:hypothetical protein